MPGTLFHNQDNFKKFGAEFEAVNKWLDEFDKTYENHRQYRHHKLGVERIRAMFGDDAAEAAINHIIVDMGGVPKNSRDYLENYSTWDEQRSASFKQRQKERKENGKV